MTRTNNSSSWRTVIGIVLVCGLVLVSYLSFNRGYGKVSYPTYQVATALYSACLSKSEARVDQIKSLLEDEGNPQEFDIASITDKERVWLSAIIRKAKSSDWESAAAEAKRMLDDQLQARK